MYVFCSNKELMKDFAKDMRAKTGMKTLFGRKNIKKDNTEGKVGCSHYMSELVWHQFTFLSYAFRQDRLFLGHTSVISTNAGQLLILSKQRSIA